MVIVKATFSGFVELLEELRNEGFVHEISTGVLRKRIAKKFDIGTAWRISLILKDMASLGLIKAGSTIGVFEIVGAEDEK